MVYRGGLENRFGRKPNGGSNPSLSASLRWRRRKSNEKFVRAAARQADLFFVNNNWIHIAIWAALIGGVFGLLWWQGQIQRLAVYVAETREELKKCAWPSWEELKGSTALIMIMIALLGGFVVAVDLLFFKTSASPLGQAVGIVAALGGFGIYKSASPRQ